MTSVHIIRLSESQSMSSTASHVQKVHRLDGYAAPDYFFFATRPRLNATLS